jgi:CMP-N,N'-diacetyllegionaminic acid synthase
MINGKNVIAIIPARSGSKGLPGKNTKELYGQPLIAWTIQRALQSKYIDQLVVSTDSQEIADIARAYGAEAPFLRPAEFASDEATSFSAVNHCLEFFRSKHNKEFFYILLLEPTSPLRKISDVDAVIDQLDKFSDHFDSIITVGESKEHPSITKKIIEGQLVDFCEDMPMVYRRQDNPPAFFPFGVAYVCKTKQLQLEKTFYTNKTTAFVIERWQQFEIDDIYDFICIEAILKSGLHADF